MTACDMAGAVRAGRTTASALVEDALARIAVQDAVINAFTAVFAERARETARRVDATVAAGGDPGPLAGVPFAAKNLFGVRGTITRAGAPKVTADDPPAGRDAELIARLEGAGAILVGATNMDAFAYGFVTENEHDGATANPHDPERIAGGSSGGSAAAVAAGMVPLAIGSDTNGSIRVPAALCGIFGIRPTFGTLSLAGAYPFVQSFDTVGPVARPAADLARAYDVLAVSPPQPADLAGVRIARLGGYFAEGLHDVARTAVDQVCAALGVGATWTLPSAFRAREAAFVITAAEGGERHAAALRVRARDFDVAIRDRLAAGALMPASWYVRAQRFRPVFAAELEAAFAEYDVLIAPATPYSAPRIGQRTIVVDGIETDVRPNVGVFTQPITLAGVPVVAVPVIAPGSLPAGVQLIGAAHTEARLLALAAELERRGVVGAGERPVPV
jgi:aspartyl-tRNA(Asn)/glutamyl-tRNA(Gln) amidotransferase subunit A